MTREPDVDLLAALDAGLLEPTRARAVRAAAAADQASTEVLAALAATRAELSAQPALRVPPEVAARWAAAVGAMASRPAGGGAGSTTPGTDAEANRLPEPLDATTGTTPPAAAPRSARPAAWRAATRARGVPRRHTPAWRTRRRAGAPAAATVLAAALVGGAVLVGAAVLTTRPAPADPPTRLDQLDLAAAGTSTVGTLDAGELADPARRAACLAVVAPDAAGAVLLGARMVVLDDRAGVLLVLGGGAPGRLRLVVVDPPCGPAGGTLLADVRVRE